MKQRPFPDSRYINTLKWIQVLIKDDPQFMRQCQDILLNAAIQNLKEKTNV